MKVILVAKKNIINPYIELLIAALKENSPKNIEFIYYSPEVLTYLTKLDKEIVLHIHWPEIIYGKEIYNRGVKNRLLVFIRIFKFLNALRILKKNKNARIMWTVHNYKSHENLFPLLEEFLYSNLYRNTDYFIVHTEAGRNFLLHQGIPDKKIYIIPHGIYFPYYGQKQNKEEARKKIGIDSEVKFFLNFGLVRSYKGLERLISVFNNLAPHQKIKLYIAESVPDSEVAKFLSAADYFIMGHENFLSSGAAILALSYDLPVIAPKEGDMPYIIQNNKNGFLYDRNIEGDLQRIILEAANLSNEEKTSMQENAIASVRNSSWDFVARETLKVYQN